MFDWLVKIPGSEFLKGFTLMSLVSIGLGWWLVRASDGEYPLPDKNKVNPITFAALQGRWQAVIDVVVVELIELNIVGISEEAGEKTLFIKNRTTELLPVRQVVYDYLLVSKSGSQFDGADIQGAMENALQPVYRELEQMHLYKTDEEVVRGKNIAYFIMFYLEALAITKLFFAILYNKTFLLLAIYILVIYFAIVQIVKPGERMTELGRKYIREVNKHFSWLKNGIDDGKKEHSSLPNHAMRVAIFGVGILAYSEIFDGYQTFAQSKRDWNGNGSGSGDDGLSGGCGGDSGGGCGGCGGD